MNLFFRIFYHVIASLFRKSIPKNGIAITPMRVQISDLDLLGHVNNGQYFSLMDIGRIDFILRAKGLIPILKQGVFPIVSGETIRFYRSLNPFQSFQIHTELVSCDERSFYLKQSFYRRRNLHAVGYVQGMFLQRGRKGVVPPLEVLQMASMQDWNLVEDAFVREWKKSLALLRPNSAGRPSA